MTFPHFKNKNSKESLFGPEDIIKYEKWDEKRLPEKYILTYQKSAQTYFLRKYKTKKCKLYSLLTIYIHKNIGFVKLTGIGAPNAAALLEELIALGGKEFLNIGTAGGLQDEGVFLCNKSLRDEGTSHHYLPFGKYAYPDVKLTKRFGKSIELSGLKFKKGASWTIDAPYRETKAEADKYRKQGITTVEMESSALFAVAKYRKVKLASAFVVSDLLGKTWLPKFHRFNVKKAQNKLIDSAIKCLQ